MNTFQELIDNGIHEYTANEMLKAYGKRIGNWSGIYTIQDASYNFDKRCVDVSLVCRECGNKINKEVVKGIKKWSDLPKRCGCKKIAKIKKDLDAREKKLEEERKLIESRLGKTYGDYVIDRLVADGETKKYVLKCTACGNEKMFSAKTFDRVIDFRCTKHIEKVKYDERLVGRKNNFLEVVDIARDENNRKLLICKCDCGALKLIESAMWANGKVKSCGCKRIELLSKPDGISHDRLYHVYHNMINRCYNNKNMRYRDYGGRGIKICSEWLSDYLVFKKWAYENGYDENAKKGECTIDRIDVNGNYEPSNCRWISNAEQQKNKRPSSEWKERKHSELSNMCKKYGTEPMTVRYRMKHNGMTLMEAVTIPKRTLGRPRKEVVV